MHEQAEVEVAPQEQPKGESHSSSVPELETECLAVTPDVSPWSVPVPDVDEDQLREPPQHDGR
jgi:hypothetical protein